MILVTMIGSKESMVKRYFFIFYQSGMGFPADFAVSAGSSGGAFQCPEDPGRFASEQIVIPPRGFWVIVTFTQTGLQIS